MSKYAAQTQVSTSRSREEIEKTLQRYGATGFMYAWQGNQAIISFIFNNMQIKHLIKMPEKDDTSFTETPTGRTCRSEEIINKKWEQATRQRWRALALVIKAKLELIESGISSIEDEFMAWIVTPDGKQVRDHVFTFLDEYKKGNAPKLLLPGVKNEN